MYFSSRLFSRLLLPLGLALAGCGAPPEQEHFTPADAQTLAADAEYLESLFAQAPLVGNSRTVKADLADERHYRLLLNRFSARGHTPESSPQLFESLRLERERALAQRATGGAEGQVTAQAAPCNHALSVTKTIGATDNTYDALATNSCSSTIPYHYIDVFAYRRYAGNLVGSTSNEAYGWYVELPLTVTQPRSYVLRFESTVCYSDYDDVTYCSFVQAYP